MPELGSDAIAAYQRSARLREERRQLALSERRRVAEQVARAAAQVLKDRYGATRVLLYGSVAHGLGFHAESDIDLAAEGIPPAHFWRAWAAIDSIEPSFEINLVALEEASPSLQALLESQGVVL